MSRLRRAALALRREAISRRAPHGLFGLDYLHRDPGPLVEFHRALWRDGLPGWPPAARLAIEAWLWLRWMLFGAWQATWRAMRQLAGPARRRDGVSVARQARRVLSLALGWCIPPAQAYQLGLHVPPPAGTARRDDPALRYVFPAEMIAWHRRMNEGDPERAAAVALLQDKEALARLLAPAGIPIVRTLATCPRSEQASLETWVERIGGHDLLAPPGLFLKSRDGHGGAGAFAVWRREDVLEARTLDGESASGPAAVERLWRALAARGDILAQPRLRNHPGLVGLAGNDDAITIRVITARDGASASVRMAIAEIPVGREGWHWMWPVRLADGALQAAGWDGRDAIPLGTKASVDVPLDVSLPSWPQLREDSIRAHLQLGALAFVAWDWIVTPEGGLLLEGNAGWAVTMPQSLFGPLAATESGRRPPQAGRPASSR